MEKSVKVAYLKIKAIPYNSKLIVNHERGRPTA
jgi:hypothetical protein